MRIWSLHPKYLDAKGLVALWRETILAQHVLEEKTVGYQNHPQLIRFRNAENPVQAINQYLSEIYFEAKKRQYKFDKEKINWNFNTLMLNVSRGQIDYEFKHLLKKLKTRDVDLYNIIKNESAIKPHPIFNVCDGEIEEWEKF